VSRQAPPPLDWDTDLDKVVWAPPPRRRVPFEWLGGGARREVGRLLGARRGSPGDERALVAVLLSPVRVWLGLPRDPRVVSAEQLDRVEAVGGVALELVAAHGAVLGGADPVGLWEAFDLPAPPSPRCDHATSLLRAERVVAVVERYLKPRVIAASLPADHPLPRALVRDLEPEL
jgi:hypothetical protein